MARDEQQASSQLDIEGQINATLKKRSEILKAQNKYLAGQVQIAMEMCNALNCEGLEGMQDRLSEIQDGMKAAADDAEKLKNSAAGAGASMSKAAGDASKKGGLLKKVFSPMGGMFAGLGVGMMSAFKGATNMVGGFISSAMRVTSIIGDIGKSLIRLPFSLLNNLTDLAMGAGGGVSALRQAMEDVREEFGSLAKNEGKQVMDGFGSMKTQFKDMAQHGISIRKHFGPGSEGAAAALKAVSEQMTDLGESMTVFGDEVSKNAGKLHVYRKGLGLTGEAFKSMATMAQTKGKSLTESVHEVGSMAINMGKQFGIGPKELAKSMASMAGDVANFGTLSTKQLGALAVYTKKLGIEAKELTGVIDKFDNFEDAAKSASQLSQAFGMNIDAMKMMKEQDPGKRMDMLRESFQATGKSVEDLSRQELKLLAAQMGLSEEAAKKALSSDMDYDELTAGAEDAEAKTISQAEAMKELADSLKQVFGSGGGDMKTFSEALAKGFQKGIMRGQGMRKMFRNIRKSMRQVYLFGRDLGQMFVKMFPGIQDMIKGLTDLFSPARFKKLRKDLLGAFRQLFTDLRTDPKGGVENFSERIKKIFGDFFDSSKGPGKTFMKGIKTFGKTVLLLILNLIPVLMKGFASLIHKLADFIKDPSAFTDGAVGLSDGLNQALMSAWENIKLTAPVLGDAFYALWEAIKPSLGKLWEKMWPWILSAVILKTVLTVAANMTLGAVFGALFKGVAMLFSGALKAGSMAGAKKGSVAMKSGGGFIASLKSFIASTAAITPAEVMMAIKNIGMIVVFLGVSVIALAGALWAAVKIVSNVDPIKLGIMTTLLIATMFAMQPISAAAIALKAVSWKDVMFGVAKVALAMGALALVTVAVGAAIMMMPKLSIGQVLNFFATLGVMLVASGIAILAAVPVGNLAQAMGSFLVQGLAILGVVMIALGAIGLIVGGMLSLIPNPDGVAKMMAAISVLMVTTALMLPVAGALGALLMAFPFGTAGVGIILAGFGVLGTIVAALVGSVLPSIREISKLNIANPDRVKTVVDMIINVVNAIANFVGQFARVLEALKPPPDSAPAQMEKNIRAAKDLLDSMMKNGINDVIKQMTELAKQDSSTIKSEGIAAGNMIASVLSAIGSIFGAMSPSVLSEVANSKEGIDNDEVADVVRAMTDFSSTVGSQMGTMMDKLTAKGGILSKEFIQVANSISTDGMQFIKLMPPMIASLAEISKAMQPDPAALAAMAGGSEGHDNDAWADTIGAMTRFASTVGRSLGGIIKEFTPVMKDIIKAVGEMIAGIPKDVPAETITAASNMLGPIFEAIGSMITGIFPVVNKLLDGATDKRGQINTTKLNRASNSLTNVFNSLGGMFKTLGPSLSVLINSVVRAAAKIKDPEGIKPRIEIIGEALDAVKNLMEMFNPDTSNVFSSFMSSADKVQYYVNGKRVSMMTAAVENMNSFTKKVLVPGGPLEKLVKGMGKIKITKSETKNIKKLKPALDAVGTVFDFVKTIKELQVPESTVGSVTGVINDSFGALNKVDWSSDEGLKGLVEKISGGKWNYTTRTVKSRVEVIKQLTTAVTEMDGLGRALSGMKANPSAAVWKNANSYFGNIACAVDQVHDKIQKSMKTKMSAGTKVIKAIAKNFEEINNLLATTDAIEMTAALNKFGENMSINTSTVKIENKPINITVDLHITMNADDIASSLNKKAKKNKVALSMKAGTAQTTAQAGFTS